MWLTRTFFYTTVLCSGVTLGSGTALAQATLSSAAKTASGVSMQANTPKHAAQTAVSAAAGVGRVASSGKHAADQSVSGQSESVQSTSGEGASKEALSQGVAAVGAGDKGGGSKAGEAKASGKSGDAATSQSEMDLKALESRLVDTDAIGFFTKLGLKSQIDELTEKFRDFHASNNSSDTARLAGLREQFDLLLMKVLTLLQNDDPGLHRDVAQARPQIWRTFSDPVLFAKL